MWTLEKEDNQVSVISSFAIISLRADTLLELSSCCYSESFPHGAVGWSAFICMIVAFPGHTHLLFGRTLSAIHASLHLYIFPNYTHIE